MFKLSILVVLLLLFSGLSAQKTFTLDDVVSGGKNYLSFSPETIEQLQWVEGADLYSYTKEDVVYLVDPKTRKEKSVLDTALLGAIFKTEKYDHIPSFQWVSKDQLLIEQLGRNTLINLKNGVVDYQIIYPATAENIDFSLTSKRIAYTIDNNLYMAAPGFAKIEVTNESNLEIINGQTYHRNEFGISKGTFWSPQGNLLAFARKDETMVKNYPLVNIDAREADLENIKYPMAGMDSHEVTIGIYNPANGAINYLDTGEPADHYLTNLAWSPDEKYIYIAELNRQQNHMQFNCYSVESGDLVKTLFEEVHPKYVEPQNPMLFIPGKNSEFIWQSMRDGHNHLYHYTTEGELLGQLTSGAWDVISIDGFSDDASKLFYTSTQQSPIERHCYSLNLKSKSSEKLTPIPGVHQTTVSGSGKYILDNWSNTETPRKIDVIEVSNGKVTNLLASENPYEGYGLGQTSIFTIKAADDSTDLWCRLITPPHFDSNKKYPVIVYVYGGPHVQLIENGWMGGARMWQHYMAQKGYIAFTIDNRGSAYRGRDFENVIHRQLGQVEMADQMKGIEYLSNLRYADMGRIGVHGWSYGGFMTTSLMTNYPETFKVGVAGGPVIDWKYYEIMYGERYMDTPQENPDGYHQTSLLNNVSNLKGRLMIIHGAIDPVVVWQHSLSYVRQCVIEGVQLDYFVYPRHKHNVRGSDRVHLMEKVSRYFDDFL